MPHLIKNIIKKCFLGLWCLTVYLNAAAQNQIGPLGTWREHYNNKSVLHLVKGDLLYGATPNQVFSIDEKNKIIFIGPSADSMNLCGDKMKCKDETLTNCNKEAEDV